jgi:hypothetical protein
VVCSISNIDRAGERQRKYSSAAFLAVSVLATLGMNFFNVRDPYARLVLPLLFQVTSSTFAQVPAKTCMLHSALGTTEERSKFLPIKAASDKLAMRIRGIGVMAVGLLGGLFLGFWAYVSIYVSVQTTPHTLSVMLNF